MAISGAVIAHQRFEAVCSHGIRIANFPQRLPASISVPLLQISAHLEVLPVATYAAVCLWNFKPLFPNEHVDSLENLATLTTFTGSIDESWFYLVSVAIEARAGPAIPLMLRAIEAARRNDTKTVTSCLETLAETLDEIGVLLKRMHEGCDPQVFYHRIRPFLAGSKNMAEAGLPNGVIYEDKSGDGKYHQYSGGSNAQSSILQFFDIILGVQHRPTGEKKDGASNMESVHSHGPKHGFLLEMREYMPGPHKRFLEDMERVSNIPEYVNSHKDNVALTIAFDSCLAMLTALRNVHLNIVTRYVIMKSRESRTRERSQSPVMRRRKLDIASASNMKEGEKKELKGTGGTALVSFLKQARDETTENAVNGWAKKMMTKRISKKGAVVEVEVANDRDAEVVPEVVTGLATTWIDWSVEDSAGGICNY